MNVITDTTGQIAPSPFLPGTNIMIAWDSTSLGYLKTCARLYEYIIIKGYQARDESVHLRFGIEYHHALQDYDLSRAASIGHDDAVHDVVRELLIRTGDFDPDHKSKTREGLVRTVIWYLDQHKNDPATTFILSDGKPAVEQSFRFELDWGPQSALNITATEIEKRRQGKGEMMLGQPYILCGHLDKVVTYNGELFVMDHKTTKAEPSSWYFTQYEPDNQMTLYSWAGKIVLNTPVRGVIIDAAQIGDTWSHFGRGFTFRTPDQLVEWFADLRYWLTLAEQFAVANYWPMNDKSCNSYRSQESESIGCPFRSVCSKSPQVRESFLDSNFIKLEESKRWNPLLPR